MRERWRLASIRGTVAGFLRRCGEQSRLERIRRAESSARVRRSRGPGAGTLSPSGTNRRGRHGRGLQGLRSDDAFSKEVAIKIVQWATGDENILHRFRTERQILANLEHPNIARLLDGGTTADGSPFLVMEYIQGVPIDQYVGERKPPLRALLELFRRICAAVGYAHRNLVVHRDLKPGNILVADGPDGIPEPKLLDFGIARLLDDTGDGTPTRTRAMTLEYASPEQVAGSPIGTASDIYSLGVLLYELVAVSRPYRPTSGQMELAEAICREDPLPLSPSIDADLANIVLMTLRKEPGRRYESAEQLSEDLRRFTEGYPVRARPDTRGYRARKFLGRNRFPIAAAALILITLTGGVIATVRQSRIADSPVQRCPEAGAFGVVRLSRRHRAIARCRRGPENARQRRPGVSGWFIERSRRRFGSSTGDGGSVSQSGRRAGPGQPREPGRYSGGA